MEKALFTLKMETNILEILQVFIKGIEKNQIFFKFQIKIDDKRTGQGIYYNQKYRYEGEFLGIIFFV
jgi:hypothetical protein